MLSTEQLKKNLAEDINNHYFEFLPTSAENQLLANLKLGFIFICSDSVLPYLGVVGLWSTALVKGLTVFAVGNTILEMYDFFTSRNLMKYQRGKNGARKAASTECFPFHRLARSLCMAGC